MGTPAWTVTDAWPKAVPAEAVIVAVPIVTEVTTAVELFTSATAGAELGWRSGWAKWPAYYLDSLPPAINLGAIVLVFELPHYNMLNHVTSFILFVFLYFICNCYFLVSICLYFNIGLNEKNCCRDNKIGQIGNHRHSTYDPFILSSSVHGISL